MVNERFKNRNKAWNKERKLSENNFQLTCESIEHSRLISPNKQVAAIKEKWSMQNLMWARPFKFLD